MSLPAGTRFGTFEIVSLLGAGGMGEVYLARDTRLHRDVALKVLPASLTADADRLARFGREAQVLASLNHVNIAAIHGLEEVNGQQALVLELVEGPTLADRIAQGPLPLDEALPIARQIAEAVEFAHEQGIVHRDLKPANVKVRPDGTVKVLDFGLAKMSEAGGAGRASGAGGVDVTASPTMLSPATMTSAGVILGTAAYMAPEQARGKPADRRADIWGFGCVLFEMLTGRRAFEGDEVTDTLAGILRGEPAWHAVPAATPRSIQRLLRRCLQKDPRERLQSIGDARLEIADALALPGDETAAVTVVAPRRGLRIVPVAAASVVTALLIGAAAWTMRPVPATVGARVTRSLIGTAMFDQRPEAQSGAVRELYRPERTAVALSPDGRTLVFRALAFNVNPGGGNQSALFVRSLDSLTSTPIRTTTGAESPFFSPDGAWIGYWDGGELRRVPVSGSNTYTTITRLPEDQRVFGVSWGDGDVVVYAIAEGIWRVPASGGTPELVTKAGDDESLRSLPHLLPGSQAILFTRQRTTFSWDDADVMVRSLATGQEKVLLSDAADARYVTSGHVVFVRRGKLMAAPFDLQQLALTGGAVSIVDDVMQAANMGNSGADSGAGQFAVATDGTLVYVTGGVAPDRELELAWVTRGGAIEPLPAPRREFVAPRLSPDGRRIAMFTSASASAGGGNRLWTYDLAQRSLTPVSPPEERVLWAVWTPDSSRIAFQALLPGNSNVSWRSADGTGSAEAIVPGKPANQAPSSWSPDGTLAFMYTGESTGSDIWIVDTSGDRQARPVVQTTADERHAAFSVDGKWLAYSSDAGGRWDVYVQPYPGPGQRVIVSPGGGVAPAWRGDGREIYYIGADRGREVMMAVPLTPTASGMIGGAPQVLFDYSFHASTPSRGYDVTPDGRRFLVVRSGGPPPSPPSHMVLVANWLEELKQLAPASGN